MTNARAMSPGPQQHNQEDKRLLQHHDDQQQPRDQVNQDDFINWDVPSILRFAFSDHQRASWLLSKEQLPPPSFATDLINNLVSGTMTCSHDHQVISSLVVGMHETSIASFSNGAIYQAQRSEPNVAITEKLVFVNHCSSGNHAFMTLVDSRIPFSFMETPSEAVKGVRRVVAQARQDCLMVLSHYWMKNGRSSLIALKYPLDTRTRPLKCMILFAPYPSTRYPTMSDTLETALLIEQPDCQFCIARGSPCLCRTELLQRMRPSLPVGIHDAWSLWKWFFGIYEVGVKKHKILLNHCEGNIQLLHELFVIIRPMFGDHSRKEHADDYLHYLQALIPDQVDRHLAEGLIRSSTGDQDKNSLDDPLAVIVPSFNADNELGDREIWNEQDEQYETAAEEIQQVLQSWGQLDTEDHSSPAAGSSLPSPPPETTAAENPPAAPQNSAEPSGSSSSGGSQPADSPSNGFQRTEKPHRRTKDADKYIIANDENREAIQALVDEVDTMPNPTSDNPRMACKLCGTTFRRKYDLKRHIRDMHLVSRDFRCSQCSRKFKRQEHLDIHVSQVHEKNRFDCQICGKSLINESNLKKHVRLYHPNNM